MLIRIILSPSSLICNQAVDSALISLLEHLQETGIVMIDDQNCIKGALYQEIKKLPTNVKYKDKLVKIFKQLKDKNRFSEFSIQGTIPSNCQDKPCQYCIKLAEDYLPMAILTRQNCNPCANSQLAKQSGIQVINVDEYQLDDYFCSMIKYHDYVYKSGQVRQDKFEQEVLIPLFRDAKHVKIYDRWIGRSILERNSDSYELTLEWMLKVFIENSPKHGNFEVYTGFLETDTSIHKVKYAKAELHSLKTRLKTKYSKFDLFSKKEIGNNQLPHQRYIVTNQVAISLDRGLDLLVEKRNKPYPRLLRDVNINYCSEPGKIEVEVIRLDDL